MLAIMFPIINPEIIHIGPLVIRWYAMAYIMGCVVGLIYIKLLIKNINFFDTSSNKIKKQFFDDLMFYCLLGIILGGRFGYVIFYNLKEYAANPAEIFYVWHGGMSFHGGLLGVIFACYLLSKKYKKNYLQITDILAPAAPIGLFLGRIANFVNAELYGSYTKLPWGVIFPNETLARHPSQLYEAFLEGIVLFIILLVLWRKKAYLYTGKLSGYMLLFYAIFRILVEFIRIPDYYIFGIITSGQMLSIPMAIFGIFLIIRSKNAKSAYKQS